METPQLIEGFKQKFDRFVQLYFTTKKENEQLVNENEELKRKLNHQGEEIIELRRKLETNELAKSFLVSGESGKDAKIKINKIVREIDNCIALLNR